MNSKKVVLSVVGIVAGIIAVCVILSLLVGVPVLKNMRYNNALSNAKSGNYVTALSELSGESMDDYKDVKIKRQEYALEAAKQYIKDKDTENAILYIGYAIEINAKENITKEAKKLYDKITE